MNTSIKKYFVVDTNVVIVACDPENKERKNKDGFGLSKKEIEECVKKFEYIIKNGGLVIDSNGKIFEEYQRQFDDEKKSGKKKSGKEKSGKKKSGKEKSGKKQYFDKFLKWLYLRSYTEKYVNRISITKVGDSYEEFPDHSGLNGFDIDDRKFIAVAHANDKIAGTKNTEVLQALDSKWWGFRDALDAASINVNFLCPDWIKKIHKKKQKDS